MADNVTFGTPVSSPPAGLVVRTLGDASGTEWPVGATAYATNSSAPWSLQIVDNLGHGLPIQGTVTTSPTGTQAISGTVTLSSQTVTLNSQTVTAVEGGNWTVTSVPSGTQTVGGTVTLSSQTVTLSSQTVTAVEGGAWTVTTVPSGTQTVGGTVTLSSQTVTLSSQTVTAAQSGTWSVTTVPSGTQNIAGTVTLSSQTVSNIPQFTAAQLTSKVISFSSSGSNTLITGTASQTIKVYGLFFTSGSAVSAVFYDGTGTANPLTGTMSFTANGSMLLDISSEPYWTGSAGNALIMSLSAGSTVGGRIYYIRS